MGNAYKIRKMQSFPPAGELEGGFNGTAVKEKNSILAACRTSEAGRRSAFTPSSRFLCFVSFEASKEMKEKMLI